MKTGWWKLTWVHTSIPEMTELTDGDRENIADLIKKGFNEGKIIQNDDILIDQGVDNMIQEVKNDELF